MVLAGASRPVPAAVPGSSVLAVCPPCSLAAVEQGWRRDTEPTGRGTGPLVAPDRDRKSVV